MPPRTERRHQQGEESRQRILDATIEIAAERGYDGTSISLVSKRSGLPASSIYWHFESKDALLAAVIDRSFNQWISALPAPVPPPPATELATWIQSFWQATSESLIDNQDFLRLGLMLSLERRPDEPLARTRFLDTRTLVFGQIVESYRLIMAGLGHQVDEALCHHLATLNLAVADGLFIDAGIRDDRAHTVHMFELYGRLIPHLVDAAIGLGPAATGPRLPSSPATNRPPRD